MVDITTIVNITGFLLGFCLGLSLQKSDFCVVGAIVQIFNEKFNLLKIYFLALATSILIVQTFTIFSKIDFTETDFLLTATNWIVRLLGGAVFGIGAILAGGCPSRQIIFLTRGNFLGLFLVVVMGLVIFLRDNFLFINKFTFSAYNLSTANFILLLANLFSTSQTFIKFWIILVSIAVLFFFIKSLRTLWIALVIGVLVALSWLISKTGNLYNPVIEEQGFSFTFPFSWLFEGNFSSFSKIDFRVICLLGFIVGSFFYSWKYKTFKAYLENKPLVILKKISGAVLMGLGIGCTIGQGLAGISLLSLSALISFSASCVTIFVFAYFSRKVKKI